MTLLEAKDFLIFKGAGWLSLSAFRPSPSTESVLGCSRFECPDKGVKRLFIDIVGFDPPLCPQSGMPSIYIKM